MGASQRLRSRLRVTIYGVRPVARAVFSSFPFSALTWRERRRAGVSRLVGLEDRRVGPAGGHGALAGGAGGPAEKRPGRRAGGPPHPPPPPPTPPRGGGTPARRGPGRPGRGGGAAPP